MKSEVLIEVLIIESELLCLLFIVLFRRCVLIFRSRNLSRFDELEIIPVSSLGGVFLLLSFFTRGDRRLVSLISVQSPLIVAFPGGPLRTWFWLGSFLMIRKELIFSRLLLSNGTTLFIKYFVEIVLLIQLR